MHTVRWGLPSARPLRDVLELFIQNPRRPQLYGSFDSAMWSFITLALLPTDPPNLAGFLGVIWQFISGWLSPRMEKDRLVSQAVGASIQYTQDPSLSKMDEYEPTKVAVILTKFTSPGNIPSGYAGTLGLA